MKISRGLLLVAFGLAQIAVQASYYQAEYTDDGTGIRILDSFKLVQANKTFPVLQVSTVPLVITENPPYPCSRETVVTLCADSESVIKAELKRRRVDLRGITRASTPRPQRGSANDELLPIVVSGPTENRVNLVFMGDGYTIAEREQFFADINRLVDDVFHGPSFTSYLPLFNIYAVYRPSAESGIGLNDTPKDTAYKLAREGNTLRAIYWTYDSATEPAIQESCAAAPACDYPIIIANDPYYGGLGGKYTITTRSVTNGPKVLRHELDHSIGLIGDEYDGNAAPHYYNANFSRTLAQLKWKKWLSGPLRVEPSRHVISVWPWQYLSDGPYILNFTSNGNYDLYEIQSSLAGLAGDNSVTARLDGTEIPLPDNEDDDRFFGYFFSDGPLAAGPHQLNISENVHDGNNMVCLLDIYEYAGDYHFEDGYVSAYPIVSDFGKVIGYRPVHDCLMRNPDATDHFCPICQENFWLQLFAKVTLIDDVSVQPSRGMTTIAIDVLKLGQFREETTIPGERLDIRWYKQENQVKKYSRFPNYYAPLSRFNGMTSIQLPAAEAAGKWKVGVRLITPEVRTDAANALLTVKDFSVP